MQVKKCSGPLFIKTNIFRHLVAVQVYLFDGKCLKKSCSVSLSKECFVSGSNKIRHFVQIFKTELCTFLKLRV